MRAGRAAQLARQSARSGLADIVSVGRIGRVRGQLGEVEGGRIGEIDPVEAADQDRMVRYGRVQGGQGWGEFGEAGVVPLLRCGRLLTLQVRSCQPSAGRQAAGGLDQPVGERAFVVDVDHPRRGIGADRVAEVGVGVDKARQDHGALQVDHPGVRPL